MKGLIVIFLLVFAVIMLTTLGVHDQSEEAGLKLKREAVNIETRAQTISDLEKAITKLEDSLIAFEKAKSDRGKAMALNDIGLLYWNLGRYDTALEYYQRSLVIRKELGDAQGESVTRLNIGLVYWSRGQLSDALGYYHQSLKISEEIGDLSQKQRSLNSMGQVYLQLGQYDRGLEYSKHSFRIAKQLGDMKLEMFSLNNLGTAYCYLRQYGHALDCYQQSLRIFDRLGIVFGKGTPLSNIGSLHVALGQYSKALDYFEQSLAISQKIGDAKQEGLTLNSIGEVHGYLGQYDKSLDYCEQSLVKHKKIGDVSGEAATTIIIANIYVNLGRYDRALDYQEQALQIVRKTGEVRQEGLILNNIGVTYTYLGQYRKASEYLEQSLSKHESIGDMHGQGSAMTNMATIHWRLGQYNKALDTYEQALQIARKTGDAEKERSALHGMANVYGLQGKYNDAIKLSNEALTIEKKLCVPTERTVDQIANYYLDLGDIENAASLIKYAATAGRLALMRSDYASAIANYSLDVDLANETGDADINFITYTGLGISYEGLKEYRKAEEFYKKALNITEDIRSGLLPSERANFFEVKIKGFRRSEPAKGLSRVRIKLNNPEGSIVSSELTKARTFSEHLCLTRASAPTGVPITIYESEQSLLGQLAALKKDLEKTDRDKFPDKYNNLGKLVSETTANLNDFVEKLWREYPAYAAVKYPRPASLEDSGLKPDEHAVIFDVSDRGVAVIVCGEKRVKKSLYLELKKEDLGACRIEKRNHP